MTGATLGAPALTDALSGAQTVLDVFTSTVANNIEIIMVVAALAAALGVIRWVFGRLGHANRG